MDTEEFAYRVYVTDSLQAAAQSKYMSIRWADMIETRQEPSKTGDEIALEVIRRLQLNVKGGE